jgi:hypothetical protein
MQSSTVKVGSSVLGFWGSLLKQPASNVEFVGMGKWALYPDHEPWAFWYKATRYLGVRHFSAVYLKALHALYYTLLPLEGEPSFFIIFDSCLCLRLLCRCLTDLPFFFGLLSFEELAFFSLWWILGWGAAPTRRWWWFLIVSSSYFSAWSKSRMRSS